jgi:hypothetical protein
LSARRQQTAPSELGKLTRRRRQRNRSRLCLHRHRKPARAHCCTRQALTCCYHTAAFRHLFFPSFLSMLVLADCARNWLQCNGSMWKFLIAALRVWPPLDRCTCLAAEPAANRLYAGAAAQVLVYDVATGQVVHTQVRSALRIPSAGSTPDWRLSSHTCVLWPWALCSCGGCRGGMLRTLSRRQFFLAS